MGLRRSISRLSRCRYRMQLCRTSWDCSYSCLEYHLLHGLSPLKLFYYINILMLFTSTQLFLRDCSRIQWADLVLLFVQNTQFLKFRLVTATTGICELVLVFEIKLTTINCIGFNISVRYAIQIIAAFLLPGQPMFVVLSLLYSFKCSTKNLLQCQHVCQFVRKQHFVSDALHVTRYSCTLCTMRKLRSWRPPIILRSEIRTVYQGPA